MKFRNWLVLVLGLSVASYAVATGIGTWDAAYEAGMTNSTTVDQVDDLFDQALTSIRERAETETCFGNMNTAGCPATADTGRSREGSARAFHVADCSAISSIFIADAQGSTALGAGDTGRLCIDSDTGEEFYWNGSSWQPQRPGFYGARAFNTGSESVTTGARVSIGFDSEGAGGFDIGTWHSTSATTCQDGTSAGCRFTVPTIVPAITFIEATCQASVTVGAGDGNITLQLEEGSTPGVPIRIAQQTVHGIGGTTIQINVSSGVFDAATHGSNYECALINSTANTVTVLGSPSTATFMEVHTVR